MLSGQILTPEAVRNAAELIPRRPRISEPKLRVHKARRWRDAADSNSDGVKYKVVKSE